MGPIERRENVVLVSGDVGRVVLCDAGSASFFSSMPDCGAPVRPLCRTIANGYDELIFGFELGNEQNAKYTGSKIAADFGVLQKLLARLWPDEARRPVLVGPDPHSYHTASPKSAEWLAEFLEATKNIGVKMHAATHHECMSAPWLDCAAYTGSGHRC